MTEANTPTSTTTEVNPTPDDGFDVMRVVYIAGGVLIGLFVLVLVRGIVGPVPNVGGFGPAIEIIRDIVLIFLALEGVLIVLALAVLIAQVARLVNLLQNEVKPVLENTQQTVKHARGTVEFVGKNLSEPVIKTNAFFAGMGVLVREVFRLRAAIRPEGAVSQTDEAGD